MTQYEIDRGDRIFFADKNKNIPRDCMAVLLSFILEQLIATTMKRQTDRQTDKEKERKEERKKVSLILCYMK